MVGVVVMVGRCLLVARVQLQLRGGPLSEMCVRLDRARLAGVVLGRRSARGGHTLLVRLDLLLQTVVLVAQCNNFASANGKWTI